MKIKYHRHNKRTLEAIKLWKIMAKEYNKGMSAEEIVKSHINPKTNKPYTRCHLYWILKQVENI